MLGCPTRSERKHIIPYLQKGVYRASSVIHLVNSWMVTCLLPGTYLGCFADAPQAWTPVIPGTETKYYRHEIIWHASSGCGKIQSPPGWGYKACTYDRRKSIRTWIKRLYKSLGHCTATWSLAKYRSLATASLWLGLRLGLGLGWKIV